MLIVQFNNYHNATMFTTANKLVGNIYATISEVNNYFGLKSENNRLHQHNRFLYEEIATLKKKLEQISDSATIATLQQEETPFYYNTATVVNNTINRVDNYITLDKGEADGIDTGMGVFCDKGVVGIICTTSSNYSIAIPLLNSKSSISCRIKGEDCFSTLKWEGGDVHHSTLVDLPQNINLEKGDTVVTSGFSSIFPADIPIGTVESVKESADGMFHNATVVLFTDFASINKVYIVGNKGYEEQMLLEKSIHTK